MTILNKKAPWVLLFGDLAVFVLSLWLTLGIRHAETPGKSAFLAHFAPFSLLFVIWVVVFFISGLYDKQSVVFRSKVPALLIQGQVVNILIATAFFYFIPWYGISPKTTLFLYLLVSLCLILFWRAYGYFAIVPKSRERVLIVGGGREARELADELRSNPEYNMDVVAEIDPEKEGFENFDQKDFSASIVVVDLQSGKVQSILPNLYNLLFSQIRFIGIDEMYENVFDRVPLSLIEHSWFLENISTSPKILYDALKRLMDILIAFILGVLSLVFYPFVAIAIKAEDGGPVFIFQERIGKGNKPVRIAKFRSMSVAAQKENGDSEAKSVTRVGGFIRKTRIDELPQLWSVLRGSLSLIGPRPELPQFVKLYEKEVPFYGVRHLIKPGLSGWAQIYHKTPPKFSASSEDTAMKLSYDLFYIKNRSLLLDLNIALKTIKELVSRRGV